MEERFKDLLMSENIINNPRYWGVVKLSDPKVYLWFPYGPDDNYDSYESWLKNLTVNWLDAFHAPENHIADDILELCWDFFNAVVTIEEREQEAYLQNE